MKNINDNIKITIVGLGYVGMPLAAEFSKKYSVVGFDLDENRINELNNGFDRTNELSKDQLKELKDLKLTFDPLEIKHSDFFIVTVPTPVDETNAPNLSHLRKASELVGKYLIKNNIVIYESTVFPGCTEEICVPILQKQTKLKYNIDFFCGYSPERINPGDKQHSITDVIKVTSGSNEKASEIINSLYSSIITAGTYKASSIAVAEAAKVIENTQRDVNIALINELAIIFNKLNLDTSEVLEAANTKWNFMPFQPGLVGGHCIGVDPYYLTYKSLEVGYQPDMILAGRKINDNVGNFIAENIILELSNKGFNPIGSEIAILGLTFKENCPDLRNTKVVTIIEKLKHYKCNVSVSDYWADSKQAKKYLNIDLVQLDEIKNKDVIIIAVGHEKYKNFKSSDWSQMLRNNGLFIDVKSLYSLDTFIETDIKHWRL
tara:strand:+ start:104 stop:1402 length:1299 start_codon:yes stop_codon:yes gene_type:complete